jgi:peptidyl-prolyl cis-trans isomerase A (cyclophilin A)
MSASAKGQSASQALSAAPNAAAPAAAIPVPQGTFDEALLHPEMLHEKAPAVYDVKFATTAGDFTIRVTRAWSPNGADRFYNLVLHHFYDGAAFFRVIPEFMVQFGISAYPQVSAVWSHNTINDDPVVKSNHRGYITFAQTGQPNTRTTQVFINFGDNDSLDKQGFAPFGQVVEGMKSVDNIYNGYGEGAPSGRGPNQGQVQAQGRDYLAKNFPKLDTIKTATVVPAK